MARLTKEQPAQASMEEEAKSPEKKPSKFKKAISRMFGEHGTRTTAYSLSSAPSPASLAKEELLDGDSAEAKELLRSKKARESQGVKEAVEFEMVGKDEGKKVVLINSGVGAQDEEDVEGDDEKAKGE